MHGSAKAPSPRPQCTRTPPPRQHDNVDANVLLLGRQIDNLRRQFDAMVTKYDEPGEMISQTSVGDDPKSVGDDPKSVGDVPTCDLACDSPGGPDYGEIRNTVGKFFGEHGPCLVAVGAADH